MQNTSEDRRRANRRDVELSTHYDSTSIDMRVEVTNLSRCGLFLRSELLDDPGSTVALQLQLPTEAKPISIAGQVVRVDMRPRSAGMGIQFTDLSWKSKQRLALYMKDGLSQRLS